MAHHVFISYRREGGAAMAHYIRDRLKSAGFKPFLDVEMLDAGQFNKQIYAQIGECDSFILILPPHALDRCSNESDWVRLEVEHALRLQKNIIPVMMKGFAFPEELPHSIEELRFYQGISITDEMYFDAAINRLVEMLIKHPTKKRSAWLTAVIVSLLIVACFLGLVFLINDQHIPSISESKGSTNSVKAAPYIPGFNMTIDEIRTQATAMWDFKGASDEYPFPADFDHLPIPFDIDEILHLADAFRHGNEYFDSLPDSMNKDWLIECYMTDSHAILKATPAAIRMFINRQDIWHIELVSDGVYFMFDWNNDDEKVDYITVAISQSPTVNDFEHFFFEAPYIAWHYVSREERMEPSFGIDFEIAPTPQTEDFASFISYIEGWDFD